MGRPTRATSSHGRWSPFLIGDACLTFFLLLICDFVGERNRAALTIAPSTVKVYVHRLLQKTESENRQALIQDFWKSA